MSSQETKSVGFRLPVHLYKRLEEARWTRRKNLSELLTEAVSEYCERHNLLMPEPGPVLKEQEVPEPSEAWDRIFGK